MNPKKALILDRRLRYARWGIGKKGEPGKAGKHNMARISFQRGSVVKRKYKNSTVFILRYRVRKPEGGWIEKSETLKGCKSKKAALGVLRDRLMETNVADVSEVEAATEKHEAVPKAEAVPLKFSELADVHWKRYADNANLKPSTRYAYESSLKNWIRPFYGERPVGDIDPSLIGTFMEQLSKEGLSSQYRRNIYALLKLIFDVAMEHDLIAVSPVRPKVHRPKVVRDERRSLTPEEARSFMEALEHPWRTPVVTVMLTGIRAGELLALRWRNFDFVRDRVMITHSLWRHQLVKPKTPQSRRVIGMPSSLKQVLLLHRSRSSFTAPDDFVFCLADGRPIDPDSLRRYGIYPALKRAGIPFVKRESGCHLFRHLVGSVIHRQTGSLKLAQKQLGHSTVSTTSDIYTHVDEEEIKKAAEALGTAFDAFCGRTVVENESNKNTG